MVKSLHDISRRFKVVSTDVGYDNACQYHELRGMSDHCVFMILMNFVWRFGVQPVQRTSPIKMHHL
jgi:hypothetical protein